MPRLHAEALLFCFAWTGLALWAGLSAGWKWGAGLSVGLMVVIMPVSTLVLTRTESFRAERLARWAILAVAALVFALWTGAAG